MWRGQNHIKVRVILFPPSIRCSMNFLKTNFGNVCYDWLLVLTKRLQIKDVLLLNKILQIKYQMNNMWEILYLLTWDNDADLAYQYHLFFFLDPFVNQFFSRAIILVAIIYISKHTTQLPLYEYIINSIKVFTIFSWYSTMCLISRRLDLHRHTWPH